MAGSAKASVSTTKVTTMSLLGSTAVSGHKARAAQTAVAVSELHRIKGELERADHDYQGHRAEAVKLISAAIHSLVPHAATSTAAKTPHPTKATAATARPKKTTTVTGTKNKLPQATSDAILRTAIGQLNVVKGQLAGKGAAADTAAADVTKAIGQLETALAIK
jgi:hypothetical protein